MIMNRWNCAIGIVILSLFSLTGNARRVPGTPTGGDDSGGSGSGGGDQCRYFEASNAFVNTTTPIEELANQTVRSTPLSTVPYASFNCHATTKADFQVMCYTTTSSQNFNSCIDQVGTIIAHTPNSSPDAICISFGGTGMMDVGEVRGFYSGCS